ncbi:MAG TPA: amidohydrolase family protein [Methanoregulaceae archaeon]|nr:MAG: amidohydrolase family protein [Methanolinea sp.]HON81329.1 amidohydrolase family protein [Methanoregulaceae archaeon]HPD09807.1 amidohydrolase family protein [Methanoregulaceae archaeon]HRT14472.1 amidohydrolase family protein [Methanoregulaceae archaeon]HRU30043.1 amidohydrolase family protein [Methanoregulaceae archaeon]
MGAGDLVVEGRALLYEELLARDVTIVVERGRIHRIEETSGSPAAWICPALFNAHTHVGDSVAMDIPVSGDLEETVTPPHGLKHRILAATPENDLVAAMRATIGAMYQYGTAGFADFREGGVAGVEALGRAGEGLPCRPLILGRDGGELAGDGAGISSVRDVPSLDEVVSRARNAGKLVAFHAGERDRFDIDAALSYEPDLMVHCTHATGKHLQRCADEAIPVAVCARSNWLFGVTGSAHRPPVLEMLRRGVPLLVGTDNCMTVQPDPWREMSFLTTVYRVSPEEVLRAAVAGSALAGRPYFIREKSPANFLVIAPGDSNLWLSRDPVRTLASRAGACNILKRVINS